jgi:hypothetical protein
VVGDSRIPLGLPFRAAVAAFRDELRAPSRELERLLFDVLCAAGALGYRLPDRDVNLRAVRGVRDPRRRLLGELASTRLARRVRGRAGLLARRALTSRLARALDARGDTDLRTLEVLLNYAPGALAGDCAVPTYPLLRLAWDVLVELFPRLDPASVHPLGRLARVDDRLLRRLRRESAAGVEVGRRASGRRPGPAGRALAVDRALLRAMERVLGRPLAPGYQARTLFYVRKGDLVWPHPDDPKYAANLLLCLDRRLPRGAPRGSAFVAYLPNGRVERHELEPGEALVMESGLVHAREPVARGERVVLLSIQYAPRANARPRSPRPARPPLGSRTEDRAAGGTPVTRRTRRAASRASS